MLQAANQENNNSELISYLKRFWVSSIAHFSVSDYKRTFLFLSLTITVGLFVAIVYSRATQVNEFVVNRIAAHHQQDEDSFVIEPSQQLNFQRENKEDEDEQNFVSYCSYKADRRGLNQNVIAYSLYGNFSNENHFTRYADPLKIILSNISQVYPGEVITC